MNGDGALYKVFLIVKERSKAVFDNIKNEKLKLSLLQALPFWVASVATGVLAVAYARLFLYAEGAMLSVFHYHRALLFIAAVFLWVLLRKTAHAWDHTGVGRGSTRSRMICFRLVVVAGSQGAMTCFRCS